MAKFFFDPAAYADETDIRTLGWQAPIGFFARTVNGIRVWKENAPTFVFGTVPKNVYFNALGPIGAFDILLIQNFGVSVHADPQLINPMLGAGLFNEDPLRSEALHFETFSDVPTYNPNSTYPASNIVTNSIAGGLDSTVATAVRASFDGTTWQVKAWQAPVDQLEANESSATIVHTETVNAGFLADGKVMPSFTFRPKTNFGLSLSSISVGTDGDLAPFVDVPPPVITAPTNLTVSNITSNSADLDWDV